MSLSFKSMEKINATELVKISSQIFADYITGPYKMQMDEANHIIESKYIDLENSQVVNFDGKPVGYILISVRSNHARVASMGFYPEARGKGFGKIVLANSTQRLKHEGFCSLELEVFEQNERAVYLYKNQGFSSIRRLVGFTAPGKQSRDKDASLMQIEMHEAADLCAAFDNCELPWQASAWRVSQLNGRNLAWKLEDLAVLVTSKPNPNRIALTTLIVHPDRRRQGLGRKVIKAIQNTFPEQTIFVPQICPEEAEPFFISMGFERLKFNQIQMRTTF